MTALSAHDVAAELRQRLPGVGTKKLHKLLYYCQGHHLAAFGTPLFKETISAWDMGPAVGTLWHHERESGVTGAPPASLTEAQLNTIGYVISRYGALTGADLEHLTHSETPWQEANRRRTPGTSAKMTIESIKSYFLRAGADDSDSETPLLDVEAVAPWLEGAEGRRTDEVRPDSIEAVRARLAARG